MKRLTLFGLAVLSFGLLGVSSAANLPLAGNLDPSFGSRGIVTHTPGIGGGIRGIAIQPDGGIVVAAFGSVVRYLPDGSLDSSFGGGGYVTTGFNAYTVALQPDGKIIVAGASGPVSDTIYSEFAVARYNQDGSLDASFGTDGITKTDFPEPGYAGAYVTALAILTDGKIVAAGSSVCEPGDPTSTCDIANPAPPSSEFALARYEPDGSLDPTFGNGGIVQTGFYGQDQLAGIVAQPDGKIVATGSAGVGGHGLDTSTMALARYEPDGSLDPTFGTVGEVTTNPERHYEGGPPALQHGEILVAGSTSKKGNSWFPVLARWTTRGNRDTTFGQDGFAKIGRQTGTPSAMVTQHDGKILIAYLAPSMLVRLLPNGRLDTSFGKGGIVALGDQVLSLALQTDGEILAGGGSDDSWTLARLIGGNNCVVPDLRGKTVSKASTSLKKSYCRRGRLSRRFSSKVTRGLVISTAPPRSVRLPGGAKVALVVSKGKRL